MTNAGSLRFDIYAGPFTNNDQFTSSPFVDAFRFISNISLSDAMAAIDALNSPASRREEAGELLTRHYDAVKGYKNGKVDHIFSAWLEKMHDAAGPERRDMENLTLGYATKDVSYSFVFLSISTGAVL
jgi:hypothetical protein